MHSSCFEPIAGYDARILILGSLPGAESLRLGQYYANPRNCFWRIMSEVLGFSLDLPYADRIIQLQQHRIALWDVCASAYRAGSLDSKISQAIVNDFESFLTAHTEIALICFNGKASETLYSKSVWPLRPERLAQIPTKQLPSTSSANAQMTFVQKLAPWTGALVAGNVL